MRNFYLLIQLSLFLGVLLISSCDITEKQRLNENFKEAIILGNSKELINSTILTGNLIISTTDSIFFYSILKEEYIMGIEYSDSIIIAGQEWNIVEVSDTTNIKDLSKDGNNSIYVIEVSKGVDEYSEVEFENSICLYNIRDNFSTCITLYDFMDGHKKVFGGNCMNMTTVNCNRKYDTYRSRYGMKYKVYLSQNPILVYPGEYGGEYYYLVKDNLEIYNNSYKLFSNQSLIGIESHFEIFSNKDSIYPVVLDTLTYDSEYKFLSVSERLGVTKNYNDFREVKGFFANELKNTIIRRGENRLNIEINGIDLFDDYYHLNLDESFIGFENNCHYNSNFIISEAGENYIKIPITIGESLLEKNIAIESSGNNISNQELDLIQSELIVMKRVYLLIPTSML